MPNWQIMVEGNVLKTLMRANAYVEPNSVLEPLYYEDTIARKGNMNFMKSSQHFFGSDLIFACTDRCRVWNAVLLTWDEIKSMHTLKNKPLTEYTMTTMWGKLELVSDLKKIYVSVSSWMRVACEQAPRREGKNFSRRDQLLFVSPAAKPVHRLNAWSIVILK